MSSFKKIDPGQIPDNVFKLVAKDWMLITPGSFDSYNTMTASWGGFGHLWNLDVCFVFIRPQRHTWSFMEKHQRFTLSFFPERWRSALQFCGSKSGREVNKATETGLTPVITSENTVGFKQARMIIVCRKLYTQAMGEPGFVDPALIRSIYAEKDFHNFCVGGIEAVLLNQAEVG